MLNYDFHYDDNHQYTFKHHFVNHYKDTFNS